MGKSSKTELTMNSSNKHDSTPLSGSPVWGVFGGLGNNKQNDIDKKTAQQMENYKIPCFKILFA